MGNEPSIWLSEEVQITNKSIKQEIPYSFFLYSFKNSLRIPDMPLMYFAYIPLYLLPFIYIHYHPSPLPIPYLPPPQHSPQTWRPLLLCFYNSPSPICATHILIMGVHDVQSRDAVIHWNVVNL